MIPAPLGLEAKYGDIDKGYTYKPVIAFTDNCTPLVINDPPIIDTVRRHAEDLVPAARFRSDYVGIIGVPKPLVVSSPSAKSLIPPVLSVIPSGGWHIARKVTDGTELEQPLVGWALKANGQIVPLETDPTGLVTEVERSSTDTYRIYHRDS